MVKYDKKWVWFKLPNFKALGLTRHQFGAGCVTSLGMLNFEDATAPFSGFTDCTMLLSVNAIRDEPVI